MRCKVFAGSLSVGLSLFFVCGLGDSPCAGDAAHVFRGGVGNRARGMGGAHTAWGSDAAALFWNPALLVQTPSVCFAGMRENRYGGLVGLDTLVATVTDEAWGAGVIWYGSEMYSAYHAAAAVRLGSVRVGIGLKAYRFGVLPQRGVGVGVDIGAWTGFMLGGTDVSVGISSRDLGWTRIIWESIAGRAVDQAAWVNRFGVSVGYGSLDVSLRVCGDLELALRRPPLPGEAGYFQRALQLTAAAGVELQMSWVTLRAGTTWSDLHTGDLAGFRFSFGGGFRLGGINLDLALVPDRLGLVYMFGAVFCFRTP